LRVGRRPGSGVIVNREGTSSPPGTLRGGDADVVIILADGRRLRGRTLGANNGIDSGMCLITTRPCFRSVEIGEVGPSQEGGLGACRSDIPAASDRPAPSCALGRLQDVNAKFLVSDCSLVGGDSGDRSSTCMAGYRIHSRIGGKVS